MILNKALVNRLSQEEKEKALAAFSSAVEAGLHYTLYGKRTGIAISTHETLDAARQDIRTWSVYPRTTKETITYNRILKSLGITA